MADEINCYICGKPALLSCYATNYEIECHNCSTFKVSSTCMQNFIKKCANLTQDEKDIISKKINGKELHTANIDTLFSGWTQDAIS